MNMNETKSIRQLLPYGAIKKISELTKTPYSTVNSVIDGKLVNEKVYKAIERMLKKEEEKMQRISNMKSRLFIK